MKIIIRRVNENDFLQIKKLFLKVFSRKISKFFYDWRYKNQSSYNSFVLLFNNKIIAHVGFVRYLFNKEIFKSKKKYIYSRHSSMVDENFRNKNFYTDLLKYSFSKLAKNNYGFLIWPNKNNLKVLKKSKQNYINLSKHYIYNMDFVTKNIIKKNSNKNYLFLSKFIDLYKTKNFFLYVKQKSVFIKNFSYFKKRYCEYDKQNYYFLIKKGKKTYNSLFVLDIVSKNQNIIIKIIDFYSTKNNFNFEFLNLIYYFKHHYAINSKIKLVFWNNTNIEKSRLIKKVYRDKSFFNIFLINNTNKFGINLNKKVNFYIGDTDVFINLNKNI